MAVDITLLFRASVKTVKTRNKALGVAVGGGADGSRDELFRRSPRPKGDFSSRAREVISHIGKLRDFLLEHRKEYINAYSHTMSDYGRMTDTERDQIDQDAQIFIRTCSEAIHQLRTEAHKEIHSQQVKEHRTAVLDFVDDYLKRVCKLYSEQRAIRVKRVVDKKRLSKLEPEPHTKRKDSTSEKAPQNASQDSEGKPAAEELPGMTQDKSLALRVFLLTCPQEYEAERQQRFLTRGGEHRRLKQKQLRGSSAQSEGHTFTWTLKKGCCPVFLLGGDRGGAIEPSC